MAEAPSTPRAALPSATSSPFPPPEPESGAGRAVPRGPLGRLSAWLPATAVLSCAVVVLGLHGVSARDMSVFGLYVALGLALPGLLWVRLLHPRARTLPEELALGVALGYALELLAYLPARALGAPLLVVAWPLGTYAVFLAVPRLRRHWRAARPARRTPLGRAWCLALIVICLILWSAGFFAANALTWPAIASSYVDLPYHLALAGELRHHVPPVVPTVAGEPLAYHWFVHAHLAAASWVTGIEPLVLLYRLALLPMLAALAGCLAAVGRRVTGSWTGGLIALASTVFLAAPDLYLGTAEVSAWGGTQSWTSPSQTFGALLFAPVVLVIVDLLGDRRPARGRWVLLAVMLMAVMGAKATYLPVLVAGLVAVVAVETARWFSPPRRALAALGLTVACLLVAHVVLFGGARQGLVFEPLSLMRVTWQDLTGAGGAPEQVSWAAALSVAALCLLCGLITWCGVLGLLAGPRRLLSPPVVLALGMNAAALAAVFLLGHPGQSQGYFPQASYPYLAMVAVAGAAYVVRRAGVTVRAMACAAVAGVLAACAVRLLCGVRTPLGSGQDGLALWLPYAVLLGVVLLVVAVLRVARQSGVRTCALVMCMVTAAGTPAAWVARALPGTYGSPVAGPAPAPDVPEGGLAAGRWLRDHSDPGELVATNVHCRLGYESPCDSRAFWAAALSERRMLVEGWAYTATNLDGRRPGGRVVTRPFWDRDRLRANDAVFERPSAGAVRRLRERYGVRWLFVDERRTGPGSALETFADLRFRTGDFGVYRLWPESRAQSGAGGERSLSRTAQTLARTSPTADGSRPSGPTGLSHLPA
ncbi:hypothetical protein [Nonomuraea cavernae]|uniref:Uncharacterized protein n=1 Tax=Nonomuraea cavernae TaxID=2045107 RepID=A0A918DGL7_9ACTN|nr:hypothetical protein [Nonomuraea cavernae]MCA2185142.1 hypothetical protein [Nonomuraea cavernae]GGO65540.1 hypothetical protein GCM10012289_17470 [Nonomuraea cavernae]